MENFNFEKNPVDPDKLTPEERMAGLLFPETPDIANLHSELVQELQKGGDGVQRLAEHYHKVVEQEIDAIDDEQEQNRSRLGLMLNIASMWKESGNLDQYLEELYDAAEYAQDMGYLDQHNSIVDVINGLTLEED